LLLAITVLTPVFGLPPIAACLIEVAFERGHSTAAGMAYLKQLSQGKYEV
jgi:ESS family glutamate:Na+ symporter